METIDYPHRKTKEPLLTSMRAVKALHQIVKKQRQQGKSFYKNEILMQTMLAINILGGRIPTQMDNYIEIIDWNNPIGQKLEAYFQHFPEITEMSGEERFQLDVTHQEANLLYTAIKSMQLADTPTWITPSENLIYQLMNTELKNVYPEDIKLPIPGIFIELPTNLMTRETKLGTLERFAAIGIVINNNSHDVAMPDENGNLIRCSDSQIFRGLHLYETEICEVIKKDNNTEKIVGNSTGLNSIPLNQRIPLNELIEKQDHEYDKQKKQIDNCRTPDSYTRWMKIGGNDVTVEKFSETLHRIVINLLLYMNSTNADIKTINYQPPKSKKKKSKRDISNLKQFMKGTTWLVGTNVKISKKLKEAAIAGATGTGKTWKLKYKTLVRGHYRRQPYGPGRSLRKIIWIEPFERGKKNVGPIFGHNYQCEDES
jgi:hypothetical protein